MDTAATLAALASGGVIGLILGLVGGGGSILAVPLLIYVVGVGSPHAAIGTAAVAVTVNALASLVGHARAGRVKWRCASVFAVSGMIGAALGGELGKAFDGKRLLVLFGLLMIGVGLSMLRKRRTAEAPDVRLTRDSASTLLPRLVPIGLGVVSALGLTTALSYALSGLVDWSVTAMLVVGGVAGTIGGIALGKVLGIRKGLLERGFAAVVIAVGTYVTASSL